MFVSEVGWRGWVRVRAPVQRPKFTHDFSALEGRPIHRHHEMNNRYRRSDHKRSHSPRNGNSERDSKRHRSRSPHDRKHHHGERSPKVELPFRSQHLQKHDFESYKALFGEYLDLQKRLDIDQLDEDEVKGRWKSFLHKWNRGQLAEGWYDPGTKGRADERSVEGRDKRLLPRPTSEQKAARRVSNASSDEDKDGYGPTLPREEASRRRGPTVPSLQDLQHRTELAEEDREARVADLGYERKQDRKTQKERLEEIVPRTDPGSRERQLEKKRETAISNKAFAEAKETGAEEVGEDDLMGDDGIDNYKANKRAMDKKKNEREIRKEEVLRARTAEREEKMAEHRRKEEKTMDMLKQIAQQRFGGQG